jgi:hypothetical protein
MKNKKWRSQIQTDRSFPNLKQISEKPSYHYWHNRGLRAHQNRKSSYVSAHWQHHKYPFAIPSLSFAYDKRSYMDLILQRNSNILTSPSATGLITASMSDQAATTFAFTAHNSNAKSLKLALQDNKSIRLLRILNLPHLRDQRQHHAILFHYILQLQRATPFPARCYKVARPEKTVIHSPFARP